MTLADLLRGHEGEIFYSPLLGKNVKFIMIDNYDGHIVISDGKEDFGLFENGEYYRDGECMLYPSRYQRSWIIWSDGLKYPDGLILTEAGYILQRWLQETKGIEVNAFWCFKDQLWLGYYSDMRTDEVDTETTDKFYPTYEEALAEAIKGALDMLRSRDTEIS